MSVPGGGTIVAEVSEVVLLVVVLSDNVTVARSSTITGEGGGVAEVRIVCSAFPNEFVISCGTIVVAGRFRVVVGLSGAAADGNVGVSGNCLCITFTFPFPTSVYCWFCSGRGCGIDFGFAFSVASPKCRSPFPLFHRNLGIVISFFFNLVVENQVPAFLFLQLLPLLFSPLLKTLFHKSVFAFAVSSSSDLFVDFDFVVPEPLTKSPPPPLPLSAPLVEDSDVFSIFPSMI